MLLQAITDCGTSIRKETGYNWFSFSHNWVLITARVFARKLVITGLASSHTELGFDYGTNIR